MADRESVIRDLRYVKTFGRVSNTPQLTEIAESALELLKEQQHEIWELQELNEHLEDKLKEREAVEPTLIREGRNKHYNDYVCPRCDNEVVYEQNYCSECGVPFLWEGR